jgi:hypothetical protein
VDGSNPSGGSSIKMISIGAWACSTFQRTRCTMLPKNVIRTNCLNMLLQ